MARSCPICDRPSRPWLTDLFDDRYGYPGTFTLRRCGSCDHGTLDAELSPAELARLYTEFYPRGDVRPDDVTPAPPIGGFSSWLNGDRRLAYGWVPPGVRVLDIGCGLGETLLYHRARGCEVQGVEADENVRRVAERFGLDVRIGLFDPDAYEPASFDWVTMEQVLEHVIDPVATLRGVATVLRPGGTAVVSTPNAGGWGPRVFRRRWIHWHAPYHLQFFTRRSMMETASRAGLAVARTAVVTSSEWIHYQWAHLATYPARGSPSAFWSRCARATVAERRALLALSLFHRTRIDHIVTRLLDAAGVGDNLVFVLERR